jgi:hypothetical protein
MEQSSRKRWLDRCSLCLRNTRVEHLTRVEWSGGNETWPLAGAVCGECWLNLPPVIDTWSADGARRRMTIVSRAY